MTEAELREQMCLIGRLMHQNGYVDGAGGNISARLDRNHILTTPSGIAKGFMKPEQMLVVDLDGNPVKTSSNTNTRPTSELIMHLECYRQRPDIHGVVHAHPPTTVALSISGHLFTELMLPEVLILLGPIPILPYATPASDENRNLISQAIQDHDVLVLAYHGSLTVAKTVWDAYLRLENLEHTAKILYMVRQLGGPKSFLSEQQTEQLINIRERLGLLRPGQREILMKVTHQ
ncbi:MAG: class II aldolase/adducin family protein [Chloroflexi bacterium]|nr:class II aldolase/adducin family protein [Chloroflexota bacterium]MCC6891768.1 class II aldolase/adducin family protein [Anaerolineae bacterium]